MKFLFWLIASVTLFNCAYGKIFTKCEFVKKISATFPNDKLADWSCLVSNESSYNSRTKGSRNRNGSYDYGIFQINDKYWCKVGSAGGDCNIDCNSEFFFNDLTTSKYLRTFINSRRAFGWRHQRRHRLRQENIQSTWFFSVVWMEEQLQRKDFAKCSKLFIIRFINITAWYQFYFYYL